VSEKKGIVSCLNHCNLDYNVIKRGVWFTLMSHEGLNIDAKGIREPPMAKASGEG